MKGMSGGLMLERSRMALSECTVNLDLGGRNPLSLKRDRVRLTSGVAIDKITVVR
jgi:hypothetical protein